MVVAKARALRIVCVDDNELIAQALGARIVLEPTMEWIGNLGASGASSTASIEASLRAFSPPPDVVLMDVDMPGVDTFALVESLSVGAAGVRVVMFSGHINRGYIERALDCGAWGYLSKNDTVATVIEGIRQVGRGEIALSKEAQIVLQGVGPASRG